MAPGNDAVYPKGTIPQNTSLQPASSQTPTDNDPTEFHIFNEHGLLLESLDHAVMHRGLMFLAQQTNDPVFYNIQKVAVVPRDLHTHQRVARHISHFTGASASMVGPMSLRGREPEEKSASQHDSDVGLHVDRVEAEVYSVLLTLQTEEDMSDSW
ncbi:hypothetical protein VP1G_10760 [Cytospora mali]|uniref:Uncharacterized protein n=1 Tax=Cytospora mali TaxID=578113 RepID=A0A194UWZ4_CYTMA|nr:hypothetical protein VP1G_10760 [Valsa mali var. pyri (nom. inval.)]